MDLVSGLSDVIDKEDIKVEIKDPGSMDRLISEMCLQLLENAREIGRLSRVIENGSTTIRDDIVMNRMISDAKVVQGKAEMTKREKDVVMQLVEGKTNRQISGELGIDEKTVKNHLWKIYKKLGVNNRTQLLHRLYHE